MAADNQPNVPFWPGNAAAGQGDPTVTPTASDADGYAPNVYVGRNAAGVSRNQVGPNAAGQPKAVAQP